VRSLLIPSGVFGGLLTGQAPVSGLATKAATPDPLLQSPANHGAQFGGRETSFRQI